MFLLLCISLCVEVLLLLVSLLPLSNKLVFSKYVFGEAVIVVGSFIQLLTGSDAAVKEQDNY